MSDGIQRPVSVHIASKLRTMIIAAEVGMRRGLAQGAYAGCTVWCPTCEW